MADVKWIKITTDIFDDEKILLIESMPEADSIIVIWFKLLCMAGKQNNSGVFMLNDKIAYTDEMLATVFRRPLNTVRLALQTFEMYGMIEVVENVITLPNWEKHQSLDELERKKEQNRKRVAAYREKQKLLASSDGECNAYSNVHETQCNAIERDKDIEEDKEEEVEGEREEDIEKEIKKNNNHLSPSRFENEPKADRELLCAPPDGESRTVGDGTASTENKFIPPTIDEVKAYFAEKGYLNPEKFYGYYTDRNWTQSNGQKVQRWKLCVATWQKKENAKLPAYHYDHESRVYNMAVNFDKKVAERLGRKPSSEKTLQSWANTFNNLAERTGHNLDTISKVAGFSQFDPYFRDIITTPYDLSAKFDRIMASMIAYDRRSE